MGCNTSKESTVPQENESKENQNGVVENSAEHVENKDIESKSDPAENHVDDSTAKSASAKTVTLRSSSSAKSIAEEASPAAREPEEQLAATKIQAAFRGHRTRQSMKQPAGGKGQVEAATAAAEPTRQQLEEEFRMDDQELCNAATKIQASFRGHMSRKQENEKQNEESQSSSEKKPEAEEELDIDLTDPDLNKAAVKIQASFRGHMTRKEQEADAQPNN